MANQTLEFENDKLYAYTPLPEYGEGMFERRLVMTKEIFLECYKKWVLEQTGENT